MLKSSTQIEIKIGERVYSLSFSPDSPIGELHDALFKMRSFVVEKINEAIQKDAPEAPKQVEEPKSE